MWEGGRVRSRPSLHVGFNRTTTLKTTAVKIKGAKEGENFRGGETNWGSSGVSHRREGRVEASNSIQHTDIQHTNVTGAWSDFTTTSRKGSR